MKCLEGGSDLVAKCSGHVAGRENEPGPVVATIKEQDSDVPDVRTVKMGKLPAIVIWRGSD